VSPLSVKACDNIFLGFVMFGYINFISYLQLWNTSIHNKTVFSVLHNVGLNAVLRKIVLLFRKDYYDFH